MKKRLAIVPALVLLISCFQADKQSKFTLPPGYDYANSKKLLITDDLDEISGMNYIGTDSTIVTVNDEEGKLYILDIEGKIKTKAFKFAKKSDFEDLCFDGIYWYMIKSNGEITRIGSAFTDSFSTRIFEFPEKGWEFETIFIDKLKNKVVAMSKVPLALNERKIPAFSLDTLTGTFNFDPYYSPDTLELRNILQKKKTECKPTAAAFHPMTGELYILSVNERLLVTMKDGKVNAAYKLDKKIFRQPEGITFLPSGDLLISNEAQDATPNIIRFKYQSQSPQIP